MRKKKKIKKFYLLCLLGFVCFKMNLLFFVIYLIVIIIMVMNILIEIIFILKLINIVISIVIFFGNFRCIDSLLFVIFIGI